MISELFLQDWFSRLKRGKSNGGIRKQKKRLKIDSLLCVRTCVHVTTRPYISRHHLRRLTRASGIFPYRLVVVPVDPSHAVDPHVGDSSHLQGHTHNKPLFLTQLTHIQTHLYKTLFTSKTGFWFAITDKIGQYKTTERRRNVHITFISENESFLHLRQKTSTALHHISKTALINHDGLPVSFSNICCVTCSLCCSAGLITSCLKNRNYYFLLKKVSDWTQLMTVTPVWWQGTQ